MDLNQAFIQTSFDNGMAEWAGEHVREDGDDVNPHKGFGFCELDQLQIY
jgi:hypothetical protein